MKSNGWLSFFLGLPEFTETLGHKPNHPDLKQAVLNLTPMPIFDRQSTFHVIKNFIY